MASNSCCAGSKKQKMNNQPHGHSSNCNNYVHQNGHATTSLTNGHGLTNGGSTNGHSSEPSIANSEMCFFCFAVLDSELNNLAEPQSPHFTNDA